MIIAMSGASGNMGREALKQTMEYDSVELMRILLQNNKESARFAKCLKKLYGDRIDVVFGSIHEKDVCERLVADANYVINMAAVIPPESDANAQSSRIANADGVIALVNAVKKCKPQPKYVHISTVALYGNRNEKHPFGRVGDPLVVSPFDVYAKDKLFGERYVLDSDLDCWAVLRQTAMLHPNMMKDNLSDGLMFHTPLNAPLEWVSSRDSGYLIKRIIERDAQEEVPNFWKKIYNIGAGYGGRCTGYETFNYGFEMIGGSAEKFFKPNWFASRNFHGMWFADSDELNNLFAYQRDTVQGYWKEIQKAHPVFSFGKFVPKSLLYIFLFKRLLYHRNSPYKWLNDRDSAKVQAYFGCADDVKKIPTVWKDTKLIAKGDYGDYAEMKKTENAEYLSHGYDEDKPIEKWRIEDLRQAAEFRGGQCLSEDIGKNVYKKVKWQCAEGHTFESSPYTVLRGGHWCPHCTIPEPCQFDRIAKVAPFYAQIWYDSHDQNENCIYYIEEDGNAVMREDP